MKAFGVVVIFFSGFVVGHAAGTIYGAALMEGRYAREGLVTE